MWGMGSGVCVCVCVCEGGGVRGGAVLMWMESYTVLLICYFLEDVYHEKTLMLRFCYLLNIYCQDKLICLFASSFDSASVTGLSSFHCFMKSFKVLHERVSILASLSANLTTGLVPSHSLP